jgi:hypothetical protein
VYGAGVIESLGAEADQVGAPRVMAVTARSLEDGAIARRIAALLGKLTWPR